MKKIKSYLFILLGITLTAFGVSLFYIPNRIVTGGVSGISAILYTVGVPPGVVYFTINIILVLISAKVLGRQFALRSAISTIVLSALVQIFSAFPPLTDNLFIAAFFGSMISGFGTAITFSKKANTGGSDIVGRLIQNKLPYFPIGRLLLIIDGVIIFISVLVFKNTELAFYGIFGLIVSSVVIDYFMDRLNQSKLALVVTENGEELSKAIMKNSRRGVTILDAKGAYSGSDKKLLVCAIKNRQMPDFHKMITEADKNAFIIFLSSEKIFGSGFYVYE
ncbi:MAG: YitT family protein [Clostridia bacterium]|nr:YitT family protein [Clostridia bacterium]